MDNPFKAIKVSDNVFWVGAIDWNIRNFHGYSTGRGSTYNAYLVMGDKVVLIDTVKAPFEGEMMARIASLIDPKRIDYIVSNHSEMDHTGCLRNTIRAVEPEKVFASAMGAKAIYEHFGMKDIQAVADGESLDLGNMKLTFLETRMLHWPDSMVTYLDADKILFSQDGFGMHLAGGGRFADEIDEGILRNEAARYFANILMPFAPLVTKLLARIENLGIEISIIAPDHGPIYRENVGWITDLWGGFAEQKPTKKAVVLYDTMWGSTDRMARSIADGLIEGGASVELRRITASHRSDVATDILEAGALIVGSPTLNNNIFPPLADAMIYLKGLKPRNLIGAAFGSYGWSGEAVGHLEKMLEEMKVELVHEGIKIKYVPTDSDLSRCREMGIAIAEKL